MRTYDVDLIPGDGIGAEVLPAALTVVEALGARHGFGLRTREHDWSCQRWAATGRMAPDGFIDTIAQCDAVLLGAVGWPGVPDHVSLWGLLIPLRRAFDLYVNLRPVRRFPGLAGPLRSDAPIDLVIVRENTEGEYSDVGTHHGTRGEADEVVTQEASFSRVGVSRIADYAFQLAAGRRGAVCSATKSNGITHTMPFWDAVVRERSAGYPAVSLREEHIDALAAKFVLSPQTFDVVLASNLFGDILSDLAAAVAGSIGIAPAANLDPSGKHPSVFEPVHGSAPDIAGQGIANPIGMIHAAAMMLDHLGETEAAAEVVQAIERLFAETPLRTPDLGGSAGTDDITRAIVGLLR